MIRCGNCGRVLDNPNRLEAYERCRYCSELFCSPACVDEHMVSAHAPEAVPTPDEDEERP
jgi:hypothetical protein